jgi:hypothetical protein
MKEIIEPTLLPPPILNPIFSPHSIPYSSATNPETGFWTYGLGTYIHTYRSHSAYYHAGGLPGQYTYQLVLPELGKGVVVFSGDDTYSAGVNKVVAYHIMDGLLGDGFEGDWEERILGSWVSCWGDSEDTSRKEEEEGEGAAKVLDGLKDIVGVYRHPSYPDMEISVLSPDSPLRPTFPTIQQRTSSLLPLSTNTHQPIWIAKPISVFIDTILFTHHKHDIYNWIATKLYTRVGSDGEETGEMVVPFVDGFGKCVFGEKERGLGMGGDWWVSGGKRERDVESEVGEEVVEVWYDKV